MTTTARWQKVMGLLAIVGVAQLVYADDDEGRRPRRYCTDTARAMLRACGAEAQDDYWNAIAKCINEADEAERERCTDDASETRAETLEECKAVRTARREACVRLGEERYDPVLDPAAFKTDYSGSVPLNAYLPLRIGNSWTYAGGDESSTVTVLGDTKLIDGVRCIVVRDTVLLDGRLKEDTDDWFAEAADGTVWYFGEEVKDYDTFAGDLPARPELVSIDGSFKTGRERDKAGILFPGTPEVGRLLREEFSLGNAEDVSEVVSTTYAFGTDPALDAFVPAGLASLLCAEDCVVTKNANLLEPEEFAYKYYARGLGLFLEVKPDEGAVLELKGCNVDPRCAALP